MVETLPQYTKTMLWSADQSKIALRLKFFLELFTVVLKVAMSCQGCSGAVQRALSKMEGVDSFNVDLKEQKVTVSGNVKPEDVFQTVSKTGKKTSYWEAETETKTEAAPDVTKTKIEAPPAVSETKTETAVLPTAANTAGNNGVPATTASTTTTA